MGFSRKDVEEALTENKYNDIMATYLLLSRKVTEVGTSLSLLFCLMLADQFSQLIVTTY